MLPARDVTTRINWVLDNLLPPLVRDSPWLMRPLLRLVFGRQASTFADFKDRAPFLSQTEILQRYERVENWFTKRPTDLNRSCLAAVLEETRGDRILDAGCGRGTLARRIAEAMPEARVTGVDMFIGPSCVSRGRLDFAYARLQRLPFPDRSFDTVVCTHTLEHVVELGAVVRELRRVARQRLLVVVPRQREHRYTFDLHVHFFPYEFSLHKVMQNPQAHTRRLGGDFFYLEEVDR